MLNHFEVRLDYSSCPRKHRNAMENKNLKVISAERRNLVKLKTDFGGSFRLFLQVDASKKIHNFLTIINMNIKRSDFLMQKAT